jgi:hypothetical protein
LSYDKGATFTVIQSIIGGCPLASSYPFTIPADAPEGEAIWAWTWSNTIGNREQYMNCAAVTIGGGGAKRDVSERAEAFSSRPQPFVANIGNGCSTIEGKDVLYPNPGPDVVNNGGNQAPPVGTCGAAGPAPVPGSGDDNGNGNGNGGSGPSPSTQAPAPTPTIPGGVFITVPSSSSTPAAIANPTPTTLVMTTRPAANPGPTGGAGSGSGSDSGAGGYAVGTACSSEGLWNCVGGSAFQRCASGAWSQVQQMATGTSCQSGEADTLKFTSRKFRPRRRQGAKLQL